MNYDWEPFLRRWNQQAVEAVECVRYYRKEPLAENWLSPGATEAQIAAAEARLGVALPPSYRQFLRVTNGLPDSQPMGPHMHPAEDVDWFAVGNQDWIDAYVEPPLQDAGVTDAADDDHDASDADYDDDDPDVSDADYFVYGPDQHPCMIRGSYLQTALEISALSNRSFGIFLLNPRVVREGEWEAWDFRNELAGSRRFRSFWDMMQTLYQECVEKIEDFEQQRELDSAPDPSLEPACYPTVSCVISQDWIETRTADAAYQVDGKGLTLLAFCETPHDAEEILKRLGPMSAERLKKRYLHPLLLSGLLGASDAEDSDAHIPEYQTTEAGGSLLRSLETPGQ